MQKNPTAGGGGNKGGPKKGAKVTKKVWTPLLAVHTTDNDCVGARKTNMRFSHSSSSTLPSP